MGQWVDELANKTGNRLRVLSHHGPLRSKDPAELVDYDIVLVFYQTLGTEYSKALKVDQQDGHYLPPVAPFSGTELCWMSLTLSRTQMHS